MKVLFMAILLAISGSLFAQNYNLGFEEWNGTFSNVMRGFDSCSLPLDAAINNSEDRLPDWTVSLGVLRTTDAHSGDYAAVVCIWYAGSTGTLSFGFDCGTPECKCHFDTKLFGVSGYYKYDPNILRAFDSLGNKKTMAYLKTFFIDTVTGSLEVLSYDSLEFSPTDNYTYFRIVADTTDSTIVPDSVSLWFASQSSIGSTWCPYAHFLYLDDLAFHFSPMPTTSIKENPLKKN